MQNLLSNEDVVKKIIMLYTRPTLEYAAVACNLHIKKHIENIEKAQRAAIRWVLSLRHYTYKGRLSESEGFNCQHRKRDGKEATR